MSVFCPFFKETQKQEYTTRFTAVRFTVRKLKYKFTISFYVWVGLLLMLNPCQKLQFCDGIQTNTAYKHLKAYIKQQHITGWGKVADDMLLWGSVVEGVKL